MLQSLRTWAAYPARKLLWLSSASSCGLHLDSVLIAAYPDLFYSGLPLFFVEANLFEQEKLYIGRFSHKCPYMTVSTPIPKNRFTQENSRFIGIRITERLSAPAATASNWRIPGKV